MPYFALCRDSSCVSDRNSEPLGDLAQCHPVGPKSLRFGHLFLSYPLPPSPFGGSVPGSRAAVRVGVLNILRASDDLKVLRCIVLLIQVHVIDLHGGRNGSMQVSPNEAMCTDASQAPVDLEHHTEIAFTSLAFSSSSSHCAANPVANDGVSPYAAAPVNGQGAIFNKLQSPLQCRWFTHAAIIPRKDGNGVLGKEAE